MRVTEKHLRDEVLHRCVEFLDIMINAILYVEQIYSTGSIDFVSIRCSHRLSLLDTFEKRFKYNLIVYECQDSDVQQYIYDFLHQIKSFIRDDLIDQIALVISTNDEDEKMLRRYLLEFRPILDSSSSTVHRDGHVFLAELDAIFADCLKELMRQTPIIPIENNDDEEIQWKLQMRFSPSGSTRPEFDQTFFEQFKLTEHSSMPIQQIKSFHAKRLNLQYMCQEKRD